MDKFTETYIKLLNEENEMILEGKFGKTVATLGLLGAMTAGTMWHAKHADDQLKEYDKKMEQTYSIEDEDEIDIPEVPPVPDLHEVKKTDSVKKSNTVNQSWIANTAVPFIMKWEGKITDKNGNHVVYDDYVHDKVKRKWDGKSDINAFIKSCKGKPTIGYGDTATDLIKLGKISDSEAKSRLIQRLKNLDKFLSKTYKHYNNMTENQKTALLSFCYNLGKHFIESGTVKMKAHLKAGNLKEMAHEMLDCNKVTIKGEKVPVKGLTRRRLAEHNLIIKDI